ncbi:MAG: hypothetical protein MJ252_20865 [archaeon]|nr:hypothetical protein [archaeon]
MSKDLEVIQENVKSLNVQYMDDSNKLTILQNHQMLIQLEFQAQKIESLEKEKEMLNKKIYEMKNDLQIHEMVENNLMNKIKTIQNNSQNLPTLQKTNKVEDNLKGFFNVTAVSEKNSSMNYIMNLEKKIHSLEKKIKEKKAEEERLKTLAEEYKNKVNEYETKYVGLFNFFEEALNNFANDEELKTKKDIYINIDRIKHCDFTVFNTEEKYSLLVLLMKYLLPIVSLNLNKSCNIGNNLFDTNLNLVNRKFNMTQRYLNDPALKRAFLGKNNKIEPSLIKRCTMSKFSSSIPVLRKNNSGEDPKFFQTRRKIF